MYFSSRYWDYWVKFGYSDADLDVKKQNEKQTNKQTYTNGELHIVYSYLLQNTDANNTLSCQALPWDVPPHVKLWY